MKYYIYRQWYSQPENKWHDYDCPLDRYFRDKKIADFVCKYLNETKTLYGERYVVKEVEDEI